MFKVIESLLDTPTKMIGAKNTSFIPGLACEWVVEDGVTVCGLSTGRMPYGIVSKSVTTNDELSTTNLVEFFFERMIFRTDILDHDCEYESGNSLYVNEHGYLTSILREQVPVGKVISNFGDGVIEALWI